MHTEGRSTFFGQWKDRPLWPAVYLTMQAFFWYRPWEDTAITSFDRLLGAATSANADIAARTGRMMAWVAVLIPLCLLALWLLCGLAIGGKQDEETGHLTNLLRVYSGIGFLAIALDFIRTFGTDNDVVLRWSHIFPLAAVILLLIWAGLRHIAAVEKIPMAWVHTALMCSLPVSFTLQIALGSNLNAPVWQVISALALLFAVALPVGLSSVAQNRGSRLPYCLLPLSLTLPAILVWQELGNILNRFSVFFGPLRIAAWVLLGLGIAFSVAFMLLPPRKKVLVKAKTQDYRQVWYPIVLTVAALLSKQPYLQTYAYSDFFERANNAVSISGFLNFGQIPSVETHAAHMMTDYLEGIIWGLINGDSLGACFTWYSGVSLALTVLLFYGILRRCVGRDAAFAVALLLPITGIGPGDWYCNIAYIPVLALCWVLRERNFSRFYLFWLSCAFAVLWRGDIGLSVGGGCILVLATAAVVQMLKNRTWKEGAAFAAGGVAATCSVGLPLVVLCVIKGINPFSRLREFLEVMALSNQNWAYESLATDTTSGVAMVWTYFVTPVAIATLVAVQAVRCIRLYRQGEKPVDSVWMFYGFSVAYFINFPRTLVRHCLYESIPVYCLAMGAWALALGIWLIWRGSSDGQAGKPGRIVLPALLLAGMLFSGVMFNGQLISCYALLDYSYMRFDNGQIAQVHLTDEAGNVTLRETVNKKVDRVVIAADMQRQYSALKKEMDDLLDEDDTYLDFTNQSTLYALLKRKSPVYVNQSPGLLSGEYSQQKFIEQIEADAENIPVALLPKTEMLLSFSLDGVQNTMRYYRVAEYIYTHYVPYKTVDNFAIWLRSDSAGEIDPDTAQTAATGTPVKGVCKLEHASGFNASFHYENGELTVTAEDEDPQITNFQAMLGGFDLSECSLELEISYTSDKDGDLQLFYAEYNRGYSESNSVRAKVVKTTEEKTAVLKLDYEPNLKLRLDTPGNSVFTITGIKATAFEKSESISYEYDGVAAHTYNMGATALLWGEQDTRNAADNPVIENALTVTGKKLTVDRAALGGVEGRYLKLVITANDPGGQQIEPIAELNMINNNGSSVAGFRFELQPGTHTYLIRVSCDSLWYSGAYNTYQLSFSGCRGNLDTAELLMGD